MYPLVFCIFSSVTLFFLTFLLELKPLGIKIMMILLWGFSGE
uniref:Uncharacterized protein n=1 Tax=Rhizophora mucronata TaxID=61149 RepID=A0A2P2R2I6_RHIMU